MTNKEFYGDKVLAIAIWSRTNCHLQHELFLGKACTGKKCSDCAFVSVENLVNWLRSEYEPPLLKNGDGLKPGDWIMVRDKNSDEWKKRQFLCFFEGRFCCLDYGCSLQHYTTFYTKKWKQARLPMEGE